MIIDGQLHEPGPRLEWPESDPEARYRVMTEMTLSWMETVGTDRAALHPIFNEWAEYAVAKFPDRFKYIPMIMQPPGDDTVYDYGSRVEELAKRPAVRGIRLIVGYPHTGEGAELLKAGRFDDVFAAAQGARLPIFVMATDYLPLLDSYIEKYPDIEFALDHLGIPHPPMDDLDSPRWRALDDVLALARHSNVNLKLCGAPALSEEGYPFNDVWPALERIIEAFGAERLFWASDAGRFYGRVGFHLRLDNADSYPGRHTLAESIGLYRYTDRLDNEQKRLILGGTLERILKWPAE
jgi:L-fuconolactonase